MLLKGMASGCATRGSCRLCLAYRIWIGFLKTGPDQTTLDLRKQLP
jgi:hypothetical protein